MCQLQISNLTVVNYDAPVRLAFLILAWQRVRHCNKIYDRANRMIARPPTPEPPRRNSGPAELIECASALWVRKRRRIRGFWMLPVMWSRRLILIVVVVSESGRPPRACDCDRPHPLVLASAGMSGSQRDRTVGNTTPDASFSRLSGTVCDWRGGSPGHRLGRPSCRAATPKARLSPI
jgi:hypothetical protein